MNVSAHNNGLRHSLLALGFGIGTLAAMPALACNDQPYLGMVCMTAATYCPQGYAEAAGQDMPINQYQALFAVMGYSFGGTTNVTFKLPDLRGRNPVGYGAGPGLTPINFAQAAGAENVTLTQAQMPAHTHTAVTTVTIRAQDIAANSAEPANNVLADPKDGQQGDRDIYSNGTPNVSLNAAATTAQTQIAVAGGNQPFSNRSPYLGMRYCVAVEGLFPPRD